MGWPQVTLAVFFAVEFGMQVVGGAAPLTPRTRPPAHSGLAIGDSLRKDYLVGELKEWLEISGPLGQLTYVQVSAIRFMTSSLRDPDGVTEIHLGKHEDGKQPDSISACGSDVCDLIKAAGGSVGRIPE